MACTHRSAPRRAGEKDSCSPISVFHFFFPGRATARAPLFPLPSSLFSAALFARCATLSLFLAVSISISCRRSILRAANARGPSHAFSPLREPLSLPSLSHFVFTSKCGIQQGFHAACGGAESAPVCRYARGSARRGCRGEMMRRLAGSSQKPPPSRLLALLLLFHPPIPLSSRRRSRGSFSTSLARSPPVTLSHPRRRRSPRDGIQPPPPQSPSPLPPPHHHPTTIPTATQPSTTSD